MFALSAKSHPHSQRTGAVAAGSAILLMSDKEGDGREADEQIDEILNARPLAEDEIHDIPIIAHIATERDQSPVECADADEDERDTVQ